MSNSNDYSFLSYVRSFFVADVPKAPVTQKYNLLVTKGTDHLTSMPGYSAENANPTVLAFDDEHDFISVSLTAAQAAHLANVVPAVGDHFEEESVIQLPPHKYFPMDAVTSENAQTSSSVTATPGLQVSIPQYAGSFNGHDVAVLDTLIVTDAPPLKGYKVSVVKSFVGNTPCEPHGTNVSEIIATMFDPQKTDMQILNFAVFDCNGSVNISTLVKALKAIIDYKKGPGKDRALTVNFSGGGSDSQILDKVFAKLPKNDIGIVVASGNSGKVCTLDSPARISINTALQSVGALAKQGDPQGTYKAGQDLAVYSNFATPKAPCVNVYYQGCYPLTDPFTGRTSVGCGTSFASPVGTGRTVAYRQALPHATLEQIKHDIEKDSMPVIGAPGTVVNSVTPALMFNWTATQKQANAAGLLVAEANASESTPEPDVVMNDNCLVDTPEASLAAVTVARYRPRIFG